ncbi:uncharacterized protein BDZ99DRAFT_512125 [Mytilinidion resinicola]|uniref:Glycoside hydrolase family 31 N-terminal domain-containing protein n=1 Tax=Mytilinidion resinicola TaxID=574789 RepID=A0A6A6Y471_9PEZI|nr:uncharacterized protein BDZ99DRAFT_512125 [Mytilinidion resinicola]KAF2803318.1 hypothetical protein BDZ99DRAFT_512125 [Mytilinidion resinicola]
MFSDIELHASSGATSSRSIKAAKDTENLSFSVGDLSAKLDTRPKSFDLSFYAKKKLMTKLGWRSLGVGDKVYGLVERFGPLVKNGQMWNNDGGTGSELTYKNIPFFITSAGYGVFIPTSSFESLEIQSERTTRINISTFDLWLSTSFTTNYDEHTVNSFLEGMEKREIPLASFEWCDYEFDKEYFPDAKGQLARLKAKGIHKVKSSTKLLKKATLSNVPMIRFGNMITGLPSHLKQWQNNNAGMAFIEFTNPDTCKWYQGKFQALVDMGVDSFKTDFGERMPTGDTMYFDGSSPEKLHNYYSYLYNKVTSEVLEKSYGKNNAALSEAMAETPRGGLSLALSSFGYWAHDLGSFEGNPDPALFKRWIAFGLFFSHSHLHGSGSFRVPWLLDETGEADKVLKHTLMPYLYAQAIHTHRTGVPMLRAAFLEYPEDPAVWYLDTQYFLGSILLVAPVFTEDGSVTYYIPKGEWYGLLDGKIRTGPGYVTETHDFFSLPVLLRPGAVVAQGKVKEKVVVVGRTLR